VILGDPMGSGNQPAAQPFHPVRPINRRERMMHRHALLLATALAVGAFAPGEAKSQAANAELIDRDGQIIGNVALRQMEHAVRIFAQAEGLPPGAHGFHIHETGSCEPPDFESAGGHFNPEDAEHGHDNPGGPHAGDLPNVHVASDGVLAVELFTDKVTLGEGDTSLLGDDGTAVVIHAEPDDYETDPAGEAGDRIACGVIQPVQ
jgi:superoxide dismutase, Cu-Zn family